MMVPKHLHASLSAAERTAHTGLRAVGVVGVACGGDFGTVNKSGFSLVMDTVLHYHPVHTQVLHAF